MVLRPVLADGLPFREANLRDVSVMERRDLSARGRIGVVDPMAGGPAIGVAGFEPATSATQTRRSTRLSYTPRRPSLRPSLAQAVHPPPAGADAAHGSARRGTHDRAQLRGLRRPRRARRRPRGVHPRRRRPVRAAGAAARGAATGDVRAAGRVRGGGGVAAGDGGAQAAREDGRRLGAPRAAADLRTPRPRPARLAALDRLPRARAAGVAARRRPVRAARRAGTGSTRCPSSRSTTRRSSTTGCGGCARGSPTRTGSSASPAAC